MYSEKERKRQMEYYYTNKAKRNAYRMKWKREHPERTKELAHIHYLNKKQEILKKRKKYRISNKEKIKIASKLSYSKITEERRNILREKSKLCAKNNPGKMAFQYKKRQTQKYKAIPQWADMDKIKKIYMLSADITKKTGIAYQVDHKYPLLSPYCCGLHTHSNLQIITRENNRKKGNKMPEFTGARYD